MAVSVAVIEKLMIARPAKVVVVVVIAAAVPEIMELPIAGPPIRKATIGATPIGGTMIAAIALGKPASRRPAIGGTRGPTVCKSTGGWSLHSGTCDSGTCRTPLSKPMSRRPAISGTRGPTICKSTGRRGGGVIGGRNRRATKTARCRAMIGRSAARWGGGGALAHDRMSVIAMIAILRRSRRHRTAKQRCRESQRQRLSESD
jgi:hypothetical protein